MASKKQELTISLATGGEEFTTITIDGQEQCQSAVEALASILVSQQRFSEADELGSAYEEAAKKGKKKVKEEDEG